MLPSKEPNSLRFLCAADLHLGRAIPLAKENYAVQAWENLVALALRPDTGVDAVLLAGDIFDREENLYEAIYPFEKGVLQLAEKNIPVIAVAGNHDAVMFSKRSYFSHLPGFHILGKQGTWESRYVKNVRIDGWSFPKEHYSDNPMRTCKPASGEVSLGLLHCECPGTAGSPYAPVALQDFARADHRAWILGHVHIPQCLQTAPHVFYCGSLQGLDSSEHGPRGALFLDIDGSGSIQHHFIPLAPFLWHHQVVEIESSENLGERLEAAAKEIALQDNFTNAIAIRFFLQGYVRDYAALVSHAKNFQGQPLTSRIRDYKPIPCSIESMIIDCRPSFDLEMLAKGDDMTSLLARRLLLLEKGEAGELLQKAQGFLDARSRFTAFDNEEELRKKALRTGYTLLSSLMLQKGSG